MSETTNTQPPPDFPPFPEEAQARPPVSTQTSAPKPKRPLLTRIFAIKFWGAIRLLALCVLVGLIMQVGDFAQEPWTILVRELPAGCMAEHVCRSVLGDQPWLEARPAWCAGRTSNLGIVAAGKPALQALIRSAPSHHVRQCEYAQRRRVT